MLKNKLAYFPNLSKGASSESQNNTGFSCFFWVFSFFESKTLILELPGFIIIVSYLIIAAPGVQPVQRRIWIDAWMPLVRIYHIHGVWRPYGLYFLVWKLVKSVSFGSKWKSDIFPPNYDDLDIMVESKNHQKSPNSTRPSTGQSTFSGRPGPPGPAYSPTISANVLLRICPRLSWGSFSDGDFCMRWAKARHSGHLPVRM